MRKILFLLSALPLFTLCSEADKMTYNGPDAVYIKMPEAAADKTLIIDKDTIVYSFAFYDVTSREILVPVEITGMASDRDRQYSIEVRSAANTVAGTDYIAIAATQTMPAGATVGYIKVTFLRNASMTTQTKQIDINIKTGGDFLEGVQGKLHVTLKATDRLVKPDWWKGDWETLGFGPYHTIKYREWIKIWGNNGELNTTRSGPSTFNTPLQCMAISRLKELFDTPPYFFDENNVRLTIPASF